MTDFERLGHAVDTMTPTASAATLARQRQRFVQAASGHQERRPWLRATLWTAAAATACAVAAALWLSTTSPGTAVSNAPQPAAVAANDVWLDGSSAERRVEVDPGAYVTLSALGRARVQRLSPADRRISLESGRLDVEIDPAQHRSWTCLAGAYRVDVIGTVFQVDYEPTSGALEVTVARGRLRISGGAVGRTGVTLEAGQRFQANGSVAQVDEAPSEPPPASSVAVPASSAAAPADPSEPAARTASWLGLYETGEYAAALAAAEREGFDALVARSGPAELASLADAARLSGSAGRASQALRALRQRFPRSAAASKAAFLLGRMEGSPHWFEVYLREQPSGAYAPEAAGRLMVAYRDTGDLGRARTAAQQYLARYPEGAYAELARSLTGRKAP